MDLEQRLQQQFAEHIETVSESAAGMSGSLVDATRLMVEGLLQGSRIITCGNGGSATIAQHFTAKMVDRYQRERPGLPAFALGSSAATLTAISESRGFDRVFAQQLEALGQPGDTLLAISASGACENIAQVVQAAIERQMRIVLLLGGESAHVSAMLREQDVVIRVPGDDLARIHEVHLLAAHCLCDLIDTCLLGN